MMPPEPDNGTQTPNPQPLGGFPVESGSTSGSTPAVLPMAFPGFVPPSQQQQQQQQQSIQQSIQPLPYMATSAPLPPPPPHPPVDPSTLVVTVSDPQKHGEGSLAFVSYHLTTKTKLPNYAGAELSVRRRFQDFVWLQKKMGDEFPAAILPPLPGKYRMEYIRGDRFSNDFLERRKGSLQRYMDRVSRHPILHKSIHLKQFLEANDLRVEHTRRESSSAIETLTDSFLNAFSKVKRPDERFMEFKETMDKFDKNLKDVEKTHGKVVKSHQDLQNDLLEFGACISALGAMETPLGEVLNSVGTTVSQYGRNLKFKIDQSDEEYLGNVHDYLHYCSQVKSVLRIRDQKQVDYEELVHYLEKTTQERDETARYGHASGLFGMIKGKMDELKGTNLQLKKQERVQRLEKKIVELQQAVKDAGATQVEFSNEVVKELELFQSNKEADFKDFFMELIESNATFYEQNTKLWDDLIPILEAFGNDRPLNAQQEHQQQASLLQQQQQQQQQDAQNGTGLAPIAIPSSNSNADAYEYPTVVPPNVMTFSPSSSPTRMFQ